MVFTAATTLSSSPRSPTSLATACSPSSAPPSPESPPLPRHSPPPFISSGSEKSLFALNYNDRLQPCRISVKSTGTAPASCSDTAVGNVLDLTFGFNLGSADNGDVAAITNNRDNTRSQNFTYDALNRLATAQTQTSGVTIPNSNCWGLTFGYDPWGNLLSSTISGPSGCSEPLALNVYATKSNQLSTSSTQAAGYCYDSAGNLVLTQSGTCPTGSFTPTYSYNAENQLTSTAGLTYSYDGDGKRVMKSNGTIYWYGMNSDALDETDAQGNPNNSSFHEYVFFNGRRIVRRDYQNNVNYYFSDHLGTSRVVTNSSGTILDDSDFYPFGGERVVSSSSANHYKFTGKERDSESGLDDFGARYDSSSMGRFMSPDPLLNSGHPSNPQTWNRYAYTLNNPLNIVDPTGLYNLVNNCAQDDKKCNKQFQQNSERLKNGVSDLQKAADKEKDPVKKARLEASLKALGTENDGNNVNVSFGALKGDAAGHTDTVYNDKTGGLSFNVTFDPSKISSQNSQAIDAAHEGTHITDISDPRYAAGQLSDFSDEYRAYQTSAWAASALGLSSLSFGKNGSYPIWNSSWATVDDKVLTRYIIENYKYSNGQPYKETTPHNPWDN